MPRTFHLAYFCVHRKMALLRALRIAALFAIAAPLSAVTYLVPSDPELIQRADDVVVATSLRSSAERTPGGGVVTRYTLAIDEVLKGKRARGESLTLTETGGEVDGFALYLSGMPVYVPGQTYLVFTEANEEGELATWGLELGQFLLRDGVALRRVSGFDGNWEPLRDERPRDAARFVEYIRGIVAQRIDPAPGYFVESVQATEAAIGALAVARKSYLITEAPRWRNTPTAGLVTSGAQPGADGPAAVLVAINQWNGTDSTVDYRYAGQDNSAAGGFKTYDGIDAVLFNDPNGEMPSSVLARGGPWSSGSMYFFDGETFVDIDGGIDIVVDNRSFEQACLNTVLTHEMGHTFGLRHSNENGDRAPAKPCNSATQVCTSNAIMNSGVDCSSTSSPSLRSWDRAAVEAVYPRCAQPSISSVSPTQSKPRGERVTLIVAANGIDLHYQWYEGPAGYTAAPTGPDAPTFTSDPLTTSTKFWVKVTNGCGEANSNTIVVDLASPKYRSVRH